MFSRARGVLRDVPLPWFLEKRRIAADIGWAVYKTHLFRLNEEGGPPRGPKPYVGSTL